MENNTMISLQSSDGEIFVIEKHVAEMSKMLQLLMEDNCDTDVIPVSNVTSNVLSKIIDYCKRHSVKNVSSDPEHHNEASTSSSVAASAGESSSSSPPSISISTSKIDNELEKFDEEFVKVDWSMLVSYMVAANYMEIHSLLDLTCQAAADYIKDKKVEEVRYLFGLENDFTPEEEEAIKKESAWAFDN